MAGETEDCISLQAERLPTGSISFGRFELESLSWERRSSFNHNRYLEEVEKFSRPGSVTQTRAILEAHFKKKPLIPKTSLENKSDAKCQPTETVLHHEASCSDEFEDHGDIRQPESASYGDTPIGSDKDEVMECEQEQEVTWSAESLIESMSCNNERDIGTTNEPADHDGMLQYHAQHESLPSNKVDLCIIVEQEPHNKAVIMEELIEKKEVVIVKELMSCVSSKDPVIERKRVPTSKKKKTQRATLKVKEEVEQKTEKPIWKGQLPARKNLGKSSTERSHISSGNMLSTSMVRQEREITLRTKSVRQAPPKSPVHRSSDSKSLKSEGSVNMKAKVRQENGSAKDARAMDSGIAPRSVNRRREISARQSEKNRPQRVVDSVKENTKQTGVVFNFKSDERAEKRKEYYLKLEEKLHSKEVEMNEIQAKTQEERQTALKLLRRSLNFKATPMPSFYHEAVPKVTGGQKKVAAPPKPPRLQSRSTNPGSRTSTGEKSVAFQGEKREVSREASSE